MAFNKNGKWYGAGLVLVGAVIGVALVSAGTSVVHWSGSTEFCGTFCHSMDAAYASYKKGQHAQTFSGAKAECVDCHLKYESVHSISQAQVVGLLWHKAVSGSNSLWGEIRGTLSTPEKQIEKREEMAEAVQKWMVSVDYVTCRGCHDVERMYDPKKPLIGAIHKGMGPNAEKKVDCLACHPTAGHNYGYVIPFKAAAN
jgi:nitrate/TMAO reductase-like tetraheme cytochrome c subunit